MTNWMGGEGKRALGPVLTRFEIQLWGLADEPGARVTRDDGNWADLGPM